MSTINVLGPVGYNPTGNYDPTRTYQKLDVVYYQGSSYVAISDSLGQLPTNNEYWNCIAAGSIQVNKSGASTNRPTGLTNDWQSIGTMFFDTTLGKPIWWNGTNWVDATGSQV